ncbi:hypothetical protein [Helicobacter felis]|uniref:hypothetical protein n=1 Tax=Helicobacter felis TaxID=214 RepID=UPI001F1A2191|nr:hypothetical protein [Helicobacter felis]
MITLSIHRGNSYMATQGWTVEVFSSLQEVANICLECDTSPAVFSQPKLGKSQRSSHNVQGFHNLLFFDIDNAPDSEYFSVQNALDLMHSHPVSFALIPTRNYLRQKSKDPRSNIERFRILVPTLKPPPTALISRENGRVNVDLYRIFQTLIVKALKLETYADSSPLRDIARFYARHENPPLMPPIIVEKRPMNLDFIYKKALEIHAQKLKDLHAQTAPKTPKKSPKPSTNLPHSQANLHTANVEKMKAISILYLIEKLEKVERIYKEGNYLMVKTLKAKYSIMDGSNLAHDFKSGETYGVIAYLTAHFNDNNINNLARHLERLTGNTFLTLDSALFDVIENAIKGAKNLIQVEQTIKNHYGVRFVKFMRHGVKIADNLITYPPNFDTMRVFNLPLKGDT